MSEPTDGEPGVAEVSALLEAESVGLLSTTSVHRPGYPYGSLTPFAVSSRGAPLLLLSGLAAHTKNLLADPRACLFVGDRSAAEDPLAGARVSLLGRASKVPAADEPDARARYIARHPKAAAYFELRDFALWELALEEARLIAGFGSMRWLVFAGLAPG
jgi:putative heme iron utilization protein